MDLAEQDHPSRPVAEPTDPTVVFDDVRFAYDDRTVLDGISFTAPVGTMTAIVGPSGAGKSSILNLTARFWDVSAGSITLGGVDVRELTAEQLFDMVTFVFQDVYLFQGSVRENIAFGRPDATDEEVRAAAAAAQAAGFIEALPNGYDTPVGEGGAMLSGGERQRVSIARAILKGSPIVLLDEATASVDPLNERAVQEALAALVRGRTVMVVAHRLSTIRSADQILVVDAPVDGDGGRAPGRIVERGRHDELLQAGGLYQRLWDQRQRATSWRLAPLEPTESRT